MPINSKDKGKRGERLFAQYLTEKGYPARRGAQFAGFSFNSQDAEPSPDIVCKKLDDIHFEVKWVEKLNVHDAVLQAMRDRGERFAAVAHRRNHSDWLITMPAEHFLALLNLSKA